MCVCVVKGLLFNNHISFMEFIYIYFMKHTISVCHSLLYIRDTIINICLKTFLYKNLPISIGFDTTLATR